MFGKRKQAAAAAWDEPVMSANVAKFMETLGLSDDEIAEMARAASDPSSELEERMAAADETLASFVRDTNAAWSSRLGTIVELQPHYMIPRSVWTSFPQIEQDVLTDRLGLVPSQPWNILLLATTDQTARAVGVSLAPTDATPAATEIVRLAIQEELERIKLGSTDTQAAAARIIAMARTTAAQTLGQDAVDRSRALFFAD